MNSSHHSAIRPRPSLDSLTTAARPRSDRKLRFIGAFLTFVIFTAVGAFLMTTISSAVAAPLGSAFNYQGRLTDGAGPATGRYDFTFKLFDAASGPNQIGVTLSQSGLGVTSGVFVTSLDFGSAPFNGTAYWLEISVKTNGAASYNLLAPRQSLSPTPYALYSVGAGSAATANAVANNTVNSSSVVDFSLTASDLAANQVVKSINGLHDTISLLVGPNLTLIPAGNNITFDASADWKLSGNAGTTPGTQFLGTTDAQDLIFKVNNFETLRLSTSQDLIFPAVPEFFLGFGGVNGLGTYGLAFNPILGTTTGRTFGGVDVGGVVLYGEGAGGLGVKYQSGFLNPLVEKLIMQWTTEEVNFTIQRGLKLQAYDGPIITRGWDPFTSAAGSAKSGLGRWGLFMEPGQLVCGIPDLDVPNGDRSFSVQKYTASGARTELMRVDNRYGYLMVNGVGGELAYMGGDGFGSDVQIGSLNPDIQTVAFYNAASGAYMHVYVKALTITGGSDLAEPFAMSQPDVEAGSVVVIDPNRPGRLKRSVEAYDHKVAGVVSGAGGIHPGVSMIQEDKLEAGQNVALSGRVYVQADASNGPISPGDLMTTSTQAGHAMKATDAARAQGAILGKAMTSLEHGSGLVLVLVTLQ